MGSKDGGPAFPGPQGNVFVPSDCTHAKSINVQMNGMSLRDWFAGMALQGILANPTTASAASVFKKEGWMDPELLALSCYVQADAMIAEREKGK